MKKFFFQATTLLVVTILTFLLSSCNKQDAELFEQNDMSKFSEHEKYVESLRLTYEQAAEIIEDNKRLANQNDELSEIFKEKARMTPGELIEKQNEEIENLLKYLSQYSVAELDAKIKEGEAKFLEQEKKRNLNIEAESRSMGRLNMNYRAETTGFRDAITQVHFRSNGQSKNFLIVGDINIPFTPIDDNSIVEMYYSRNDNRINPYCAQNTTFLSVFKQPGNLGTRSAISYGRTYIDDNWVYNLIARNTGCRGTRPGESIFYPLGSGSCGTHSVNNYKFGTLVCN